MKHNTYALVSGRNIARLFYAALIALAVATSSFAAKPDKVNLNTADVEALQYIPGVGPTKSAEIVRVRESLGGFKAMDELLGVPGVGPKLLLDIEQYGTLEGGVSTLTEEMLANPAHTVHGANG